MSTKLTKSAEDWSRNSGSPCCLMCLCVVVVSPFRLCHITRVYVGFFSFLIRFIRCPQRRLTVVFVLSSVCVRGLLLIYLFLCFFYYFSLLSDYSMQCLYTCSSAHPRGLHPPWQAGTRCFSEKPHLPFDKPQKFQHKILSSTVCSDTEQTFAVSKVTGASPVRSRARRALDSK